VLLDGLSPRHADVLHTETQSAAPSMYNRDALLALARSPLAVTCQPLTERFAAMNAILSAEASPTSDQVGNNIKGFSSENAYPPMAQERHARNRSLGSSMSMTNGSQRAHHKTASYSSAPFNHERYAAMYATPFTPDHSLMKPANMHEWTPSMTSPLDTPFAPHQDESAVAISPGASLTIKDKEGSLARDALRPTAKVFIPTDIPMLRSNPQPQRKALTSSMHAPRYDTRTTEKHFESQADVQSPLRFPTQSLPVAGPHAQFEIPKAITPLAAPSARLPARPTACAVAPNLPRWAHSPTHAMVSSLESKYRTDAVETKGPEPSLIRRARAATVDQSCSIGISSSGKHHTRKALSDSPTHPGAVPMSLASSYSNSGSRTPWALQKTNAELHIKGTAEGFQESPDPSDGIEDDQSTSPTPFSAATSSKTVRVSSVPHVKAVTAFDGNSWRKQFHGSFSQSPRRPSMTPSIPGGLLGAVPMHSVGIK
jgi:hypothetical protein